MSLSNLNDIMKHCIYYSNKNCGTIQHVFLIAEGLLEQ